MKKFIISFFLINLGLSGFAQVIRGTVTDVETKGKISFAYVYFNGTFTGTNTDKNGNFVLDISDHSSMPLTVSALGYYTVTLKSFSTGKPLTISLKPKVFELKEVVVSSRYRERIRKENLKHFRSAFLGTTQNSHECEILNEKDIMFRTDNDTLKAFSSNPISIDNRALGYKVTYFLDEFEYYKKSGSFFFTGSIIFNEDAGTEGSGMQIYRIRRQNAYLGSRMHFFRSLWADRLDSADFKVVNPAVEKLIYSNIVNEEDSLTKYLEYPEDLGICYFSGLPNSYIFFRGENVFFDKNGYFDPYGISWQGDMAEQRIADWLPYEYSEGK